MTLEKYNKLTRKERKMWYYFTVLANEKERHQYDKIKEENEREQRTPSPSSSPVRGQRMR